MTNNWSRYHKEQILSKERRIADLEPGERAWTVSWVNHLDTACFPTTMPFLTLTAYIERTPKWYKRLWVRGWLKRQWIWYFDCPWRRL